MGARRFAKVEALALDRQPILCNREFRISQERCCVFGGGGRKIGRFL